jgi:hypothetical protein
MSPPAACRQSQFIDAAIGGSAAAHPTTPCALSTRYCPAYRTG